MNLILIMLLASTSSVFAARIILMQASVNTAPTNQGVYVAISGRIFDPSNNSLSNALVSVEVVSPQGTSVHVAIAYSDLNGFFQDAFYLPMASPAGNYTAFLAVDKPGYDTAHATLAFAYSTPDFSFEPSAAILTLRQGQTASLSETILSLRGFNEFVNFTAINVPPGVTVQFTPGSLIPSATTTVNVQVSITAPVGNYTLGIIGVSGSLTHQTVVQLQIEAGPLVPITVLIISVVAVVVAGSSFRLWKGRRRREEIVDELLGQARADSGYVATARVIARLEELRALNKVDESTYQRLRREYEKRLEKSK